ncbi:RNA-directed DNA polymerase, eukaryota [Tanacetum coccineum]
MDMEIPKLPKCIMGSAIANLKEKGVDLLFFCKKKIGDGCDTQFWIENWIGNQPLKFRFPRLFALETNKMVSVAERKRQGFSFASFRRHPRGGVESTQWEEMLDLLNSIILSSMADRWACGEPTNWCNLIPIKINVMAWRISLDKLPTRMNLDARDIDVPSVLCPICGEYSKNVSHLFFSCSFVSQVYVLIARWWDLDVPRLNSYIQWSDWFFNLRMKRMQKRNFQALFFSLWVACVGF